MSGIDENGGFSTVERRLVEPVLAVWIRELLARIPPALVSIHDHEKRVALERVNEACRLALVELEPLRQGES